MRTALHRSLLVATAVSLSVVGCGGDDDDDGGNNGGTTSMVGTLASATETGTLSISVPLGSLAAPPTPAGLPMEASRMAPVNVTGTLHPAGGSDIALTGTYDASSHILALTGGGYSMGGQFSGGAIDGAYTGPNGSGGFSLLTGTSTQISVICGAYTGDDNGSPDDGVFNMAIHSNNNGRVLIVDNTGGSGVLAVTRSGGNLSVYVPGQPSAVIATGTISGTSASGAYDDGQGASGTWSGTAAACQ